MVDVLVNDPGSLSSALPVAGGVHYAARVNCCVEELDGIFLNDRRKFVQGRDFAFLWGDLCGSGPTAGGS
jgi:hypothetical protein